MRLIILIILIILIVGAVPFWPYSTGWGYYPVGGLGTILIIVLILALLGYVYRAKHPCTQDRAIKMTPQ